MPRFQPVHAIIHLLHSLLLVEKYTVGNDTASAALVLDSGNIAILEASVRELGPCYVYQATYWGLPELLGTRLPKYLHMSHAIGLAHREDALPEDELDAAEEAAKAADLAICLGTSLQITPACDIPLLTVKSGVRLSCLHTLYFLRSPIVHAKQRFSPVLYLSFF